MAADPRAEFAQVLRDAVAVAGLTQAQVATAVRVTQPTVSAWMLGKVIPELATIRELATLLGAESGYWEQLKLETLADNRRRGKAGSGAVVRVARTGAKRAKAAAHGGVDTSGLEDEDLELLQQQADHLRRLRGGS